MAYSYGGGKKMKSKKVSKPKKRKKVSKKKK